MQPAENLGKFLRKIPRVAEKGLLYGFGPFQLDPVRRLLLREGKPVPLTPKAFDILVTMLQKRGETLDKDELMKSVWPDTAVEEGNLTRNISTLRKVLGESPNEHQYIVTVPGKGYCFVADVEERYGEGPELKNVASGTVDGGLDTQGREGGSLHLDFPTARPEPAILQSNNRKSTLAFARVLAGGLAVGLLVVAIVGGLRERFLRRPTAGPIQSVAVLPFANLSGDSAQEYFANGVTEALIMDLAQVHTLRVISHTSVLRYKGTRKPLPEIASELRVEALVEGAVLRSGDRVRISAQLVRAVPETHLWANTYEGDLRDVLRLQNEAARAIVDQLRANLTPQEKVRLAASRPVDREAYEAYLKGLYFWNRRDVAGLLKAIDYFTQAVDKDPNYASAYAGLADAYILFRLYGIEAPFTSYENKAKAAASRALELDPSLPEVHTAVGAAKALNDWDWESAAHEFRRALELNPNYAPAHHWYATLCLAPRGQYQEAIAEMQRARELDPLSPIMNTDLGWTYFIARQYDRAFAQYKQALEIDANFIPAHFRIWEYYRQLGLREEEIIEAEKDCDLMGHPEWAAALARAYSHSGYRGAVLQDLKILREATPQQSSGTYGTIAYYALLGENNRAFAVLKALYNQRDPALIYLKVDPLLDPLRSDRRYFELLRGIGLSR